MATGGGGDGGEVGAFPDPADGVELTYDNGEGSAGPMESYLAAGGKLPVVLMTCNRDEMLGQTIEVRRREEGRGGEGGRGCCGRGQAGVGSL